MKLFKKSTIPGEKKPILEKVRENPKKPLGVILTSLLIILPFCICLLGAFLFALNYIRNDAYKYNDDTYETIEEVLCGVKVSQSDGTVKLESKKITLSDGSVKEIMPCLVKGEGLDDRELRQYLDEYGGTYETSYENGQTQVICSIKNGYFDAVVTVWLDENDDITQISRNYNSLGAYMDNLIRQVGLVALGIALVVFFVVECLIFGGLAAYGKLYNWQAEKKKKKEEAHSSEETAIQNPYMGTAAK